MKKTKANSPTTHHAPNGINELYRFLKQCRNSLLRGDLDALNQQLAKEHSEQYLTEFGFIILNQYNHARNNIDQTLYSYDDRLALNSTLNEFLNLDSVKFSMEQEKKQKSSLQEYLEGWDSKYSKP